ncbi:GNAT family N-acetyltransferase [Undibacterium sp. LX40W]|uniref:GNAT family N-acetyltransferase n=1 Tax=Undibacterium nitidum TaxID=2762298 RepID=A0A923KUT5_9BURK|nr:MULTISPECIES: GNAT family N-acetyltransferase [Undibacterium]MBC3882527.1 GNAT family N-acetyltransferase [Undibacterium nitidum]MBC3892808.1 GNAT family N-acetyltransferase [Undibacterium sp. LX40W]
MEINNDQSQLDINLIHRFLSEESTWAKGIPLEKVKQSIAHSLCFGGYENGQQIAFARVVSDFATFAYLMDVFVLKEHRGRGLSRQLMAAIKAHPELQGLRRFLLASSDARGLYQKFGFQALGKPEVMMEINVPDIYQHRSN